MSPYGCPSNWVRPTGTGCRGRRSGAIRLRDDRRSRLVRPVVHRRESRATTVLENGPRRPLMARKRRSCRDGAPKEQRQRCDRPPHDGPCWRSTHELWMAWANQSRRKHRYAPPPAPPRARSRSINDAPPNGKRRGLGSWPDSFRLRMTLVSLASACKDQVKLDHAMSPSAPEAGIRARSHTRFIAAHRQLARRVPEERRDGLPATGDR